MYQDSQIGREQKGNRPAIVISNNRYNKTTGLCIVCPITNQRKGYAFEVVLENTKTHGVVLCDHIKSNDWRSRKVKFIEKTSNLVIQEVVSKINALIGS